MKKWLCLLLSAVLMTAGLPIAAAAAEPAKPETGTYPVILLPGLLEDLLIRDKGEKTEEVIWFSLRNVARVTLKYGVKILWTIYNGSDEQIRDLTLTVIREAAGGIRMNPDGTSALDNITPVITKAEESTYNALKKSGMLRKVTYGPYMLKTIAGIVGGERTFVFQYDWRLGPVEIAAQLHDFIRDVKEMTGSDRVNAIGTSYGSTVLATYLHEYGEERDLHRVVMNSPAYGGSEVFREMMCTENPTRINYEPVLNMILCNYHVEQELGWLLRIVPQDVIDKIFVAAIEGFVKTDFVSSIGFWGCCSPKDYEECKARFLDPVRNAEMIRKADYMQHEIMAKTGEILRGASAYGTQVFSIANEGCALITGHGNGDVLVDAAGSSGGVALEVGEHFPASYTPERIICKDPSHDHVSDSGSLDLTNAHLPETTWVFYGQMHGQNYPDTRARALTINLLTTEQITDVYSDPAFPQFMENTASIADICLTRKDGVRAVLDPSAGAVTAVVTNLSAHHCMAVQNIAADGLPYKPSRTKLFLLPGQSVEITLTPTGEKGGKYGSLTLQYDEIGNLKLHKSRTQQFRIVGVE